MSNVAIDNESLDGEGNVGSEHNIQEPQEEENLEPTWEDQARDMGWVPENEWTGKPENWSPAREFVRVGQVLEANQRLHSKIDHIEEKLERKFDARLEQANKYHRQQMELQRQNLNTKMRQAVEDSDTDAYDVAKQELDNLDKADEVEDVDASTGNAAQELLKQPVVQEFIQRNPYITDGTTPKGAYGQAVWNQWVHQNATNPNAMIEEGLELVEKKVAESFPEKNPRRENARKVTQRGRGPSGRQSKTTLTFDDLTHEEKQMYDSFGASYSSKEEFLQAVADNREGD